MLQKEWAGRKFRVRRWIGSDWKHEAQNSVVKFPSHKEVGRFWKNVQKNEVGRACLGLKIIVKNLCFEIHSSCTTIGLVSSLVFDRFLQSTGPWAPAVRADSWQTDRLQLHGWCGLSGSPVCLSEASLKKDPPAKKQQKTTTWTNQKGNLCFLIPAFLCCNLLFVYLVPCVRYMESAFPAGRGMAALFASPFVIICLRSPDLSHNEK